MSYAQKKELSGNRTLAIIIVAILQFALGYAIVTGLAYNVIKHAATDQCQVTVACQEDALTLEVTDNGAGSAASGGELPAAGNGIIGMRERAAMYSGEVRAAPLPGRGFRVTARFPLAGTAALGAGA